MQFMYTNYKLSTKIYYKMHLKRQKINNKINLTFLKFPKNQNYNNLRNCRLIGKTIFTVYVHID